ELTRQIPQLGLDCRHERRALGKALRGLVEGELALERIVGADRYFGHDHLWLTPRFLRGGHHFLRLGLFGGGVARVERPGARNEEEAEPRDAQRALFRPTKVHPVLLLLTSHRARLVA